MTLEELKKEAANLGYSLIKRAPREHFLPCVCGCKQREHWYDVNGVDEEELKCKKCGFSVTGSHRDVRTIWNDAIRLKRAQLGVYAHNGTLSDNNKINK